MYPKCQGYSSKKNQYHLTGKYSQKKLVSLNRKINSELKDIIVKVVVMAIFWNGFHSLRNSILVQGC